MKDLEPLTHCANCGKELTWKNNRWLDLCGRCLSRGDTLMDTQSPTAIRSSILAEKAEEEVYWARMDNKGDK